MKCPICGRNADAQYAAYTGEHQLCQRCARIDLLGWLFDLEKEEITKLRRRAEDCLRKNQSVLHEVLVLLITRELIGYEDLM
jgi:endogenous inhibitor of DNA gyrase (YacG/DUF329 family)